MRKINPFLKNRYPIIIIEIISADHDWILAVFVMWDLKRLNQSLYIYVFISPKWEFIGVLFYPY